MKTNGSTKFSDGTICDYCSNLILTKLDLIYRDNRKEFCDKECAGDYEDNKTINSVVKEGV